MKPALKTVSKTLKVNTTKLCAAKAHSLTNPSQSFSHFGCFISRFFMSIAIKRHTNERNLSLLALFLFFILQKKVKKKEKEQLFLNKTAALKSA